MISTYTHSHREVMENSQVKLRGAGALNSSECDTVGQVERR